MFIPKIVKKNLIIYDIWEFKHVFMLYDIDIFRFRIIQIHGWINNTSLVHVALGD